VATEAIMRVCRIHGAEDLRVEDVPEPVPGRGEVLLKLGAGGICGSDLHYFLHGRIGSFVIREPLIPGHEISGTVAGIGPGVTRVREGDTVAINPSHACGTCNACRAGRENLCSGMRFLGSASVFPHVQGMFRESFVMGERQCFPVTGAVTVNELAFAEPLSVALHAVNRAGSVLGKNVLVTGSGPIGCLIVAAARLAGAAEIAVTDIVDRPLEAAKALGADRCVRADRLPDGGGDLAQAVGEPETAFEVSGSPAALAACLAATVRGGRIVQVGTLPAEGVKILANQVMAKEIDYVGTFRFGVEFEWAIRYLADRRVDVTPLLSAQYPIEEAEAAFRLASDKSRSLKVQLVRG
jgi:L-idonate 5-dehydrogenase